MLVFILLDQIYIRREVGRLGVNRAPIGAITAALA